MTFPFISSSPKRSRYSFQLTTNQPNEEEGIWRTTDDGSKIFIKGGEVRAGGPNGPVLSSASKSPKPKKSKKAESKIPKGEPFKTKLQFEGDIQVEMDEEMSLEDMVYGAGMEEEDAVAVLQFTMDMAREKLGDDWDKKIGKMSGAPDGTKVWLSVLQDGQIVTDFKIPGKLSSGVSYNKVESSRMFDFVNMTITNLSLTIAEEMRGQGIGTQMFSKQVEEAAANGFKSIDAYAAGKDYSGGNSDYNGYYTWARLGFDSGLQDIGTKEDQETIKKSFPRAKKVSDLMKTKKGREFWKDKGVSFLGKFDLSKGSQSRKVLESYVKSKSGVGFQVTTNEEEGIWRTIAGGRRIFIKDGKAYAGGPKGPEISREPDPDLIVFDSKVKAKIDKDILGDMSSSRHESMLLQKKWKAVIRKALGPDAERKIALLVGAPEGSSVLYAVDLDSSSIYVELTSEEGGIRGLRQIDLEEKVIVNESLKIEEKGKGIGTQIFSKQVEEASKLGFNRIEVRAVRDEDFNGYYTWARLGVDTPVNNLRPQVRSQVEKEFPDASYLSDIMSSDRGRSWWKENGSTFDGHFDLSSSSTSKKVLQEYVQAKFK